MVKANATYKNGVLILDAPLPFEEGARVVVSELSILGESVQHETAREREASEPDGDGPLPTRDEKHDQS